jgi:uncharacterized protein
MIGFRIPKLQKISMSMRSQSESNFKIQVRKWDGRPHYSWETHLLERTSGFIWVACPGPRDLVHHSKGKTFSFETHAMEWFWEGAWFSIGVSMDPLSRLTRFYCNLHQPLTEVDGGLEFVDLDIDVVKVGDEPTTQVDLDEFALHSKAYLYPKTIIESLPNYGEALGKAIDRDTELCSEKLGRLFDQVMVEGGPNLTNVGEDLSQHLRKWPQISGLGLAPD